MDLLKSEIISKWILLKDLNILDSAVCNKESRKELLNLYKDADSVLNDVLRISFGQDGNKTTSSKQLIDWMISRSLKYCHLNLHEINFSIPIETSLRGDFIQLNHVSELVILESSDYDENDDDDDDYEVARKRALLSEPQRIQQDQIAAAREKNLFSIINMFSKLTHLFLRCDRTGSYDAIKGILPVIWVQLESFELYWGTCRFPVSELLFPHLTLYCTRLHTLTVKRLSCYDDEEQHYKERDFIALVERNPSLTHLCCNSILMSNYLLQSLTNFLCCGYLFKTIYLDGYGFNGKISPASQILLTDIQYLLYELSSGCELDIEIPGLIHVKFWKNQQNLLSLHMSESGQELFCPAVCDWVVFFSGLKAYRPDFDFNYISLNSRQFDMTVVEVLCYVTRPLRLRILSCDDFAIGVKNELIRFCCAGFLEYLDLDRVGDFDDDVDDDSFPLYLVRDPKDQFKVYPIRIRFQEEHGPLARMECRHLLPLHIEELKKFIGN
jgi:hypothetical protein